mmetsp:Transcript_52805/g.104909  ORF Transcript_52805/g.104909 Transcript_52805/m.104909 type:complete len:297 (+) Transcript_52805:4004-4894(+)
MPPIPSSKVTMLPSSQMLPTAVWMRMYVPKSGFSKSFIMLNVRLVACTCRLSMPPLSFLKKTCSSSAQTWSGSRESSSCSSWLWAVFTTLLVLGLTSEPLFSESIVMSDEATLRTSPVVGSIILPFFTLTSLESSTMAVVSPALPRMAMHTSETSMNAIFVMVRFSFFSLSTSSTMLLTSPAEKFPSPSLSYLATISSTDSNCFSRTILVTPALALERVLVALFPRRCIVPMASSNVGVGTALNNVEDVGATCSSGDNSMSTSAVCEAACTCAWSTAFGLREQRPRASEAKDVTRE